MKFIDITKIEVKAGNGGNGIASFKKEKYIDKGGPDGGNGGKGGDVYFQGDHNLLTLLDCKQQKYFKAQNGSNGKNQKKNGKQGKDLIIKVPLGTIIKDITNNIILVEILIENNPVLILKGGRGGRGNFSFRSSTNRVPLLFENGSIGQHKLLQLEIKIIADVGIIGFPNVGKSTLISIISNNHPKIANYDFTTLIPNIGIVKLNKNKSCVVADIPGLIENACKGKGLGNQFLRHIERCKILIHMLDSQKNNWFENYQNINLELKNYNSNLIDKPQIVAINKCELDYSEKQAQNFKKNIKNDNIILMSCHSKMNIKLLLNAISKTLQSTNVNLINQHNHPYHYVSLDDKLKIKITKLNNHTWKISGDVFSDIITKNPLDNYQNIQKFNNQLKKFDIEKKLYTIGAKIGDTIIINSFQFILK